MLTNKFILNVGVRHNCTLSGIEVICQVLHSPSVDFFNRNKPTLFVQYKVAARLLHQSVCYLRHNDKVYCVNISQYFTLYVDLYLTRLTFHIG